MVVQLSEVGVGVAAAAVEAVAESVGEEALFAAVEALDEEVLPCDWAEKVAGAWNCAKLWPEQVQKTKNMQSLKIPSGFVTFHHQPGLF